MADAVANSFLVIVLPLYIASDRTGGAPFGLTDAAATGIILAAFGIASASSQPFTGRLSDRSGRRRAFVVGGLILMAGLNLLLPFAGSMMALFALRLGQGMAAALTITASVALVSDLSTRGTRGGNMGTFNSLRMLGFGSGPLVAGFVVSSGPYTLAGIRLDGYDAAFFMAAAAALLSALLVLAFVRDPDHVRPTTGRVDLSIRSRTGGVLDPVFGLGTSTFVMAGCVALLASIEPSVNARLDQDARWFGVQFAAFILSLSATQPLVGKASDYWGRRPFVIAGLLLLAPTTLAQGLAVTSWQLLFARLAQGFAGAMIFAPALALAGDLAGEGQTGVTLAVLTMAFGLGLSAGQLTAGFLVSAGYVVPFAAGAVVALLTAVLVWREVDEAR